METQTAAEWVTFFCKMCATPTRNQQNTGCRNLPDPCPGPGRVSGSFSTTIRTLLQVNLLLGNNENHNSSVGKLWFSSYFMKFHGISWSFIILGEFHVFRRISPLLVFWSVSGPPGRLKNINIPIGITRFSACGGQGTTRISQKMIFASFYRFARNSAKMVIFLVNLTKITVLWFF